MGWSLRGIRVPPQQVSVCSLLPRRADHAMGQGMSNTENAEIPIAIHGTAQNAQDERSWRGCPRN